MFVYLTFYIYILQMQNNESVHAPYTFTK